MTEREGPRLRIQGRSLLAAPASLRESSMSNTDEVEILVVGYDDVFLADAGNNLDRCGAARDADPTAHAGAAASTIFLSVASIEAFVSERLVFHELKENISRDQADRIRKLGKEHQQLNALVKCFHKEGLDGHHTYEPTQALFALRGCLIHRSASFLRIDGWPDRIEEKHRRHIEHITGHGLDWTSRVLNHRKESPTAVTGCEAFLYQNGPG